jgi:hypothetical protein
MNRQQFFNWMNDPASMDEASAGDLQEIILAYPYFQTARVLQLLNLKLIKDYRFERELRRVAGYAADRTKLRESILMLEETAPIPASLAGQDPVVQRQVEISVKDIHLEELEAQIKASLMEIELKKSRLNELLEEKKAIIGKDGPKPQDPRESAKDRPLRPLPKDLLLEEFIRQKGIASERVSFFNAEEFANKSIEENDDILSETLARLVAAQGKKEKAIKIYQKLMLKYPQKSNTFAAQIEKLRKEL